jgi:hypothetical protein
VKQLRNSVIKWLVVSLLCLLLGFLLGEFKQDILNNKLSMMAVDLQTMKIRNNRLETDFSRAQIVSVSDQQAIKSLAQSNKQLQDELAIVNNKLYFYEGVISPELEITGVKVFSFEITKNEKTESWDYGLVLMQSQEGRRFLNGSIEIILSLFEGEDLKQISLSELSGSMTNSFKFKYFQSVQGNFVLPAELAIDEVIVQLSVAGNRNYKAQNVEERFDWRVLTAEDSGDLSEFDIGSINEFDSVENSTSPTE